MRGMLEGPIAAALPPDSLSIAGSGGDDNGQVPLTGTNRSPAGILLTTSGPHPQMRSREGHSNV